MGGSAASIQLMGQRTMARVRLRMGVIGCIWQHLAHGVEWNGQHLRAAAWIAPTWRIKGKKLSVYYHKGQENISVLP